MWNSSPQPTAPFVNYAVARLDDYFPFPVPKKNKMMLEFVLLRKHGFIEPQGDINF